MFAELAVIRGTCPHGVVIFAAVDEPTVLADYATQILGMLSRGFTMDRVAGPVWIGAQCVECKTYLEKCQSQVSHAALG